MESCPIQRLSPINVTHAPMIADQTFSVDEHSSDGTVIDQIVAWVMKIDRSRIRFYQVMTIAFRSIDEWRIDGQRRFRTMKVECHTNSSYP